MNDEDRERLLAELIEQPGRRTSLLAQAQLTTDEQDAIAELVALADALWIAARGAPALIDDPIAAMLGLIPDEACRLNSAKLSQARKRAGLKVSDLAKRLSERGWGFDKSDIFRWENTTAVDVPPAVVQAVSEALNVSIDSLTSGPLSDITLPDLNAARNDSRFAALVERWARVTRVPIAVATAALESRMLATVHRGERPDTDQILQSLDALVVSAEQARQP